MSPGTPSHPPRRYPRASVSLATEVWVDHTGVTRRVDGRFVVLGAGGAFLEVDETYPIGSRLYLPFRLAPIGEIACRAIVRDALARKGVGVDFLDLEPPDRARLGAFVEQHRA